MTVKSPLSFPVLLRNCWFGLNRSFRSKLINLHLTPVQFTVLRCLYESNLSKMCQGELTHMISSNKNNTSSILKRMEKLGYIIRKQNDLDLRKNMIFLTKKGEELFIFTNEKASQVRSESIELLTSKEQETIYNSLKKINHKLKQLNN